MFSHSVSGVEQRVYFVWKFRTNGVLYSRTLEKKLLSKKFKPHIHRKVDSIELVSAYPTKAIEATMKTYGRSW